MLLNTQPEHAACASLGRLARGTRVRSAAVSASERFRLLVSPPQKDQLTGRRQGGELNQHPAQSLGIDLTVLQRFVQTGPRPLKKRRERQFGKTACSCFTGEGIHQIEQGVFGVPKAAIHLMTQCSQCVKVHLSNAPRFLLVDTLPPLGNPLTGIAEVVLV